MTLTLSQRPLAVLPPLCRPAGWIAQWRRLAMMAARNARAATG